MLAFSSNGQLANNQRFIFVIEIPLDSADYLFMYRWNSMKYRGIYKYIQRIMMGRKEVYNVYCFFKQI